MKHLNVINGVTRAFNKVGFTLRKHSPEILVVAGCVGTAVSAVMACKATLKVNTIADEAKANVEKIHDAVENGVTEAGEEYTVEDSKKDLTVVYAQTGIKFVKLYGPAVALGALSITSILSGHNILRKRNMALAAAYATVDNGFKAYRGRVVERFGEELDKELKFNIKSKEIEETVVDENGKEKTVKKTVDVVDPNTWSDYARIYDDGCNGWTKSPEHNLAYVKQIQNQANDVLKARGHLFLNEVYDMLGFNRTKAGQVVGWVYDEECPVGDNFVDFGIYNLDNPRARDFVNGHERNIILDFNVDGNIWELLK